MIKGTGEGLGISADWLNHSLSIVDLAALKEGAAKADVVVDTIDLSKYEAGPLSVEVTPDGKLALVSLSIGFFAIPGAGFLVNATNQELVDSSTLLFVDLTTRKVVDELDVGKGPMGIAITLDGKRAFVGHFGTSNVTELDIEKRKIIRQIEVGIYSEELALDDTGRVGIFSYSASGNVRTFGVSDFKGTLSKGVELTGDAAGVAFFPGTKTAYVVQAANPLTMVDGGHTIVDAGNPEKPKVLEDVRAKGIGTSYPTVAVPARESVVVPVAVGGKLKLEEIKLGKSGVTSVVQTIDIGDAAILGAYSASIDDDGRVLITVPREHYIAVVDLEKGSAFTVPWEVTAAGPTDLTRIP